MGVTVVIVAILVAHGDVAFGGKTFSTAQTTGGIEGCLHARCVQLAPGDPRSDPGASAWALEPWAEVTAAEVRGNHAFPLWNPYEGAGAPLAANMQSATFDPLLALVNLHPTPLTWDLSFLAALILIGLAAYALVRVLGMGVVAAVAGGCIYGLSGNFFFYSNNSFFRAQLYLPVVLLGVEWVLRSVRWSPILAVAVAVAGLVVVGMPEATFCVLFFAAVYALVRVFSGPRSMTRQLAVFRLAAAGTLGLALAAPLLLPFNEYLGVSRNFKTAAGLGKAPKYGLLNWFAPNIRQSLGSSRCVATKGCGQTTFAGGINWVGAGALIAAGAAVASWGQMRRYCGWPVLVAGGVMVAKIYGAPVVSVLGHLPGGSQVSWNIWGQASVAFAVAVLAAIGVQAVADRGVDQRVFAIVMGVGVAVAAFVAIRNRSFLRHDFDVTDPGGLGFAVLVAVVVIALVIVAVRVARWSHLAAWLAAGGIVLELLALAPHGFYFDRADPYPRKDWIEFLQAKTRPPNIARVFSNDNLLYPNTAGAYGLQDPRVLDAVYVDRYFDYIKTFISHGIVDRWTAAPNFESAPAMADNPMFDLLGTRYVVVTEPKLIPQGSQYRLVKRFGPVYVYENTHVLPRALVVHDLHVEPDQRATRHYLTKGQPHHPDGSFAARLDPAREAVVETTRDDRAVRAVQRSTCTSTEPSTATVTRYEPSRVELAVDSPCPGLLVLADTYYPGWKATVDGEDQTIHPTDYAFRGVVVPAGHSKVVFRYQPGTFRAGIVIAVAGLGTFVVIAGTLYVRRRRSGDRALSETRG